MSDDNKNTNPPKNTPKDPNEVPIKVKPPVKDTKKSPHNAKDSSHPRDARGHFVKRDKTNPQSPADKNPNRKKNNPPEDLDSSLDICAASIFIPSLSSAFLDSVEKDYPDFISVGSRKYVSSRHYHSEMTCQRLSRVSNYFKHIDTVLDMDKSISNWKKAFWATLFLFGVSIGVIVSLLSAKDALQNQLDSITQADAIPAQVTD